MWCNAMACNLAMYMICCWGPCPLHRHSPGMGTIRSRFHYQNPPTKMGSFGATHMETMKFPVIWMYHCLGLSRLLHEKWFQWFLWDAICKNCLSPRRNLDVKRVCNSEIFHWSHEQSHIIVSCLDRAGAAICCLDMDTDGMILPSQGHLMFFSIQKENAKDSMILWHSRTSPWIYPL